MQTVVVKLFFSTLLSFLITYALIPRLCIFAQRLGIVDTPDGLIKRHEHATPYLGGVGVYVGFIAGLALMLPRESTTITLLVGSTLLLFIGLLDDLLAMKPYQKFAGQILAALCFLKGGLFLKEQFFQDFWMIGIPISLLWLLTVINALNLVDVMDGLATTIAGGALISFLVIALWFGNYGIAIVLSSLIGALFGFFLYNRPPARIYLGDAGSLFLGGVLASVPFLFSWSRMHPMGYGVPAIILAIPLLEVVTLMAVRTYRGIPFYKASPDHFSIYLQQRGWTKNQILGYVFVLSMLLLIGSLLFLTGGMTLVQLIASGVVFILSWYAVLFIV